MKFHWLIYLFMTLSLVPAAAQSDNTVTQIYETYNEATVYIQVGVYFAASAFNHPDIIRKIERHLDIKILDDYFPIVTGSGFFVTPSGYLITNWHVVDVTDLKEMRENAYWGVMQYIASSEFKDVLSAAELQTVMREFKPLFLESKWEYRIRLVSGEYLIPEVITSDKEIDLALLKVSSGKKFKSIPIGDSKNLKVGSMVVAIGYPLQSPFYSIFKDFKSTLTTGTVSAIRKDNWSLQHTASISPGNSGGPLFNMHGEMVGVNVGVVSSGNNIYFSIPSEKLLSWLKDNKHQDVAEENEKDSVKLGSGSINIANDVLETGTSFFVKAKDDCSIYLDDVLKGTKAVLLSDLSPGDHFLRVETKTTYNGIKVRVKKEIQDIITYEPVMGKFTGNLFVTSEPEGAEIFIDGVSTKKKTPAPLSNVTENKHTIDLKLSGYFFEEKEIDVPRKTITRLEYKLVKGYKVSIDPLIIPKNAKIEFFTNTGSKIDYSDLDNFWLKVGKYKAVISGDDFYTKEVPFEVGILGTTIRFKVDYYMAKIILRNLEPESTVFLNGKDVTDQVKDSVLTVRMGDCKLLVKNPAYANFYAELTLKKDAEEVVEIARAESFKVASITNAWIGYPTLAGGVALTAAGIILNLDVVSIALTSSYSDYTTFKYVTLGVACVGVVAVVVGGIFTGISLYQGGQENAEKVKESRFLLDFTFTEDNLPMVGILFKY